MAMITLTAREKQWQARARQALDHDEVWERCNDCLRYHPEGYQGDCSDLDNRLPATPAELV